MKLEALSLIRSESIESMPSPAQSQATSFSHWLDLNHTNEKLLAADDALATLAMGKTENLHQSMLALEEARLSFLYLEQVRNRAMSAYQELLKEPL